MVDGRAVPVTEEVALDTPFGNLLHFRKETNLHQPRVLIVAPMAGHFATLLRHTARTMLSDHDVYITDWKSARDVPLAAGPLRHRRIYRSPDPLSSTISVRARMAWRCASPAPRCWRRWR